MVSFVDVSKIVQSYKLRADFKGALARLLEDNVGHVHGRSGKRVMPLSVRTQELRARALCKAFEDLHQGGHPIIYPYYLQTKHVQLLVEIWLAQGQTCSTIDNKLTHLRALAQWMTKPSLVTTLGDYVDLEMHRWRSSDAAWRKKSFPGDQIDAVTIIEDIGRTDAHIAIQLKLQAVFGLGVEESFVLRPKDASRSKDFLAIARGPKGSCLRAVSSEVKLAVLSEAAGLSDQYTGTTVRGRLTKRQWYRVYYGVLKKNGITEKGLGVTGQGLKRRFLEQVCGRLPINSSPLTGADDNAYRDAHHTVDKHPVIVEDLSYATGEKTYFATQTGPMENHLPIVTHDEMGKALIWDFEDESHQANAPRISQ